MASQLVPILLATQSPDFNTRKSAEDQIKNAQKQPGFSLALLQLLTPAGADASVKPMAAILLKNTVKSFWIEKEDQASISTNDKAELKKNIVNVMLATPEGNIRNQLAAALSIISEHDFPAQWQELLPQLVNHMKTDDPNVIDGILYTLHSVLKRFRKQALNEHVASELKYVLNILQQPLLETFKGIFALIEPQGNNAAALALVFKIINSILKIFYSLNVVDLPEYFEDNMKEYMDRFHFILNYDNPLLVSEDEAGVLEIAKSLVCENINLYMEKYEEEFAQFLPIFATDVWNLLMKLGLDTKYDILVSHAIRFLTTVSKSVHHALFAEEATQKNICEKIVIPNIKLRDDDIEEFEDSPVEYIRRDIEGSDNETRRRSASELVKGLCKHYEQQITGIFSQYVNIMLQEYAANPTENWRAKDAAIYLVTALAIKAKTQQGGTTQVNQLVNINDFFSSQILPELNRRDEPHAILKADGVKFLSLFRNQLPKEVYHTAFPLLTSILTHASPVVAIYAANCIERMLTVKDAGVLRFSQADLKPYIQGLLTNLIEPLLRPNSNDNEYTMKAVMRIINIARDDVAPYLNSLAQGLCAILQRVSQNPSNPHFNHYLFESIAAALRFNAGAAAIFEPALSPVFQTIIQKDISEFKPYVFQILSQLLESTQTVPQHYMAMLPDMLVPALWLESANIPGLSRLLQVYIRKAPAKILEGNHLVGILGVFQKLVSSKLQDHEGFNILNAIIEFIPIGDIQQYLPMVFQILFTRLKQVRTGKFVRCLILFLALFIYKFDVAALIQTIDAVQQNLLASVLQAVWLTDVQKVTGKQERKLCSVAMTKMLCQSQQFLAEPYLSLWAPMLLAQLKVLELPEEVAVDETADVYVEQDNPEAGNYTAVYSKLAFVSSKVDDPAAAVADAKQYFATALKALMAQAQDKVGPWISQLPQDAQNVLVGYLQ